MHSCKSAGLTYYYIKSFVILFCMIAIFAAIYFNWLNRPNSSTKSDRLELNITARPLKSGEAEILGISEDKVLDYIEFGYTESEPGYEYLQVDLLVNVGEEGTYYFFADLQTMEGEGITMGNLRKGSGIDFAGIEQSAALKKGVNTVSVYFSGFSIRKVEENGPYKIRVSISGKDVKFVQEVELVTSEFHYMDFRKE